MQSLSNLSANINPTALCGLILILGLLGGEISRVIKFIPKISGYIAVGILVGPSALNLVNQSVIPNISIFIDISIGLILFNLGRQLDFIWLRHDPSLFYMSLAESSLTFVFIYSAFCFLGFSTLSASFAAAIAMTTSPAVIMLIVNDLASEGPVTRRTLMLTSLNNLWGLIIFILLLPLSMINIEMNGNLIIFKSYTYQIFGSLLLGLSILLLSTLVANLVGKYKETQIILFVSMILLTISLANFFEVSAKLSLFIYGVSVRNFDWKHTLLEVDFAWGIRLALILLFVVTGMQVTIDGLIHSTLAVLTFLIVRSIGKATGIWLFARKSRLTKEQTIAIMLSLTPMAGVTMGMLSTLSDFNPDLGRQLTTIIVSVVAILHILGPVATQYALIKSGEAYLDKS